MSLAMSALVAVPESLLAPVPALEPDVPAFDTEEENAKVDEGEGSSKRWTAEVGGEPSSIKSISMEQPKTWANLRATAVFGR